MPAGPSELEAIIDIVRNDEAVTSRGLWLPPLSLAVPLDLLSDADHPGHRVSLGLVDRPAVPEQLKMSIDLGESNLRIIGGARSGVTSGIVSAAISAAWSHAPTELRLIVIDPVGSLEELKRLPQCVRYVAPADLPTSTGAVTKLLDELSLRSRSSQQLTLIVVDAWERAGGELDQLGNELPRRASRVRDHRCSVVVGVRARNEMPGPMQNFFDTTIELRLADPYTTTFGYQLAKSIPLDSPGRGLTQYGDAIQLHNPNMVVTDDGMLEMPAVPRPVGATAVDRVIGRWGVGSQPIEMPAIPINRQTLDVSSESDELAVVGSDCPLVIIAGPSGSGRTSMLLELRSAIERAHPLAEVVFVTSSPMESSSSLVRAEVSKILRRPVVADSPEMAAALGEALQIEILRRKELLGSGTKAGSFSKLVLLIDDCDAVIRGLVDALPLGITTESLEQLGRMGISVAASCVTASLTTSAGRLLGALVELPHFEIHLELSQETQSTRSRRSVRTVDSKGVHRQTRLTLD